MLIFKPKYTFLNKRVRLIKYKVVYKGGFRRGLLKGQYYLHAINKRTMAGR
jgi:hypothetical protein